MEFQGKQSGDMTEQLSKWMRRCSEGCGERDGKALAGGLINAAQPIVLGGVTGNLPIILRYHQHYSHTCCTVSRSVSEKLGTCT